MSMHKQMIGKIGPGSADITLGDYINRKQQQAAFDDVAHEKKLTFDAWWEQNNDDSLCYECARRTWIAAQENK